MDFCCGAVSFRQLRCSSWLPTLVAPWRSTSVTMGNMQQLGMMEEGLDDGHCMLPLQLSSEQNDGYFFSLYVYTYIEDDDTDTNQSFGELN